MDIKSEFINFWKQIESNQTISLYPGTSILKDEYSILKDAGLLISDNEIKKDSGMNKIHPTLQHEPFVGDLNQAKYFIINLNPRAGIPYKEEYKNWSNKDLLKCAQDTFSHKKSKYPFYYLNPILKNTGGGIWWTKRLIPKEGVSPIIHSILSTQVFDIELCPYHSRNWNPILNSLIADGKLKSSTMAIKLIRSIIKDPTKHIFIRKYKEYRNFILEIIPELKKCNNVHYSPCQQSICLTPTSVAGEELFSLIAEQISNK